MNIPLTDLISPHYCCSCGEIGSILCERCEYDIISESCGICLLCGGLAGGPCGNICSRCKGTIDRAWCVGDRVDSLRTLIDQYKFESVQAVAPRLVNLLDATVPIIPEPLTVVTVPTIPKHIRTRGFDHAAMVARAFAKRRGLPYQPIITRQANSVQRTAPNRRARQQQAAAAFAIKDNTHISGRYIILDDVCTTGATLMSVATLLKSAGADEVWVAVVARQPLEKE